MDASPTPPSKGYKDHLKEPFLKAFTRIGTIIGAAEAVGISRYLVINWRKDDAEFKSKFEKAEEDFTAEIEGVLHGKALAGDLGACIFLLRARSPAKYTERLRHEADPLQFERMISLFAGVIKRTVPPDLWPTVSAALTTAVASLQAGKGQELLS